MNPDLVSTSIRRAKPLVLSGIFFVLLWLPTADLVVHLDHAPVPTEQRLPAPFPAWNGLSQSREFVMGLEDYFNDHFGFRKRLIRANNHWKRQLFRDAPANDVITGKDGWLYFVGDRTLDNAFGVSRFTQEDLEAWRQLLERRRDWLAQRGIKYVFTIPPDKHTAYPEYLPDWFAHSLKSGKLDQFFDYMRAHSTVEVLDLRKPLLEGKPLGVNYLKTDTHWNALGAFVAYQALIGTLSRQMPDLKPLALDAFDRAPNVLPAGDLGLLMGDTSLKETQQLAFTPRPPLQPLKVVADPARLPKQWRPRTDPRISTSDRSQGKAVVFRDSFAGSWQAFVGYHFKEVIYLWQYYWDAPFIEREKPDVVIDEILERFFNKEDPKELMKNDGLN